MPQNRSTDNIQFTKFLKQRSSRGEMILFGISVTTSLLDCCSSLEARFRLDNFHVPRSLVVLMLYFKHFCGQTSKVLSTCLCTPRKDCILEFREGSYAYRYRLQIS
ncbi:Uncharacterized protein TCM_010072 [Theobroma cacao]|uniref:Uncharacterized protein n=1 Tax=Theobroma cacao TaxID=3641 RepID=A0A061E5G7_THECC|nr:Uncharacterized protein TCM_010072 [Theobroma cacao]